MSGSAIADRFRSLSQTRLGVPGGGSTPARHSAIFAAGRESLSLAKLIEAHWDAVAILEEAGLAPANDATYAVWASEVPGRPLLLQDNVLGGAKEFCSGAGIVDRALITAGSELVEVDLRDMTRFRIDTGSWNTEAFRDTSTATVDFDGLPIVRVVGSTGWYTARPGFWKGACGPAAAWAGGAAGLFDYAQSARRDDPHTLAHVGAMAANIFAMESLLLRAGLDFDNASQAPAQAVALALRHSIEQMATDTLRRFARAFGPAPLVKYPQVSARYAELDLFLRQCHGERDLQSLGESVREANPWPATTGTPQN